MFRVYYLGAIMLSCFAVVYFLFATFAFHESQHSDRLMTALFGAVYASLSCLLWMTTYRGWKRQRKQLDAALHHILRIRGHIFSAADIMEVTALKREDVEIFMEQKIRSKQFSLQSRNAKDTFYTYNVIGWNEHQDSIRRN
jgi:hypothetical protein